MFKRLKIILDYISSTKEVLIVTEIQHRCNSSTSNLLEITSTLKLVEIYSMIKSTMFIWTSKIKMADA